MEFYCIIRYISLTNSPLFLQPVKELVEEVLLGHLSSRNSIFTLSTLTGSDEVMGAVWEGVRSETGEGGRGEVERELRAVVKSLPGRGLVVPATDSATFEVSLYCMVNLAVL